MIVWIIIAVVLYLLVTGFFLHISAESNQDYFDIRNLFLAFIWPLVLIGFMIASVFKIKPDGVTENKQGTDVPGTGTSQSGPGVH